MSKNTITTGQYVTLEYTLASVGNRVLALLIDIVTLYGYFSFLFFLFSALPSSIFYADLGFYLFLLLSLPMFLYFPLMEALNHGQTFGKMAMKIRVISQNGSSPTLSAFILRYILQVVDYPLGLLPLLLTRNHQRFGDLAAGTIVVSTKMPNVFLPKYDFAAQDYVPNYPEVQMLNTKQMDVISRTYYSHAPNRQEMIDLLAEKVCSTLGIRPKLPGNEIFLQQLLNDSYYYISSVEA